MSPWQAQTEPSFQPGCHCSTRARKLPHNDFRWAHFNFRDAHFDYRRSHDDCGMFFVSPVPRPSAILNKTSGGKEEGANTGK